MTLSVDARAAGDHVIDAREAELVAAVAAAENMAGTYLDTLSTTQANLVTAQTQLIREQEGWKAEKTELEKTIEALQNTVPGPVPVRPSFGKPGVPQTFSKPTAIEGKTLLGPIKFVSGASEILVDDFEVDLAAFGTLTGSTKAITIDPGAAAFGQAAISRGKIHNTAPSVYGYGVAVTNAILAHLDISGVVDAINWNGGDLTIIGGYFHHLFQGAVDPAQKGGPTHSDVTQLAVTNGKVTYLGGVHDPGVYQIGSVAALMVAPGTLGALRVLGTQFPSGMPAWNLNQTTTLTGLSLTGVKFGPGPTGTFNGATWAGEPIIAKSALHAALLAALTAGDCKMLDGTAVTIKRG